MSILVMKFGGAATASTSQFFHLADLIKRRRRQFKKIVVVVSAMGEMTDHLIRLGHSIHPTPPKREVDMLISIGERVSIALLAMALDLREIKAISLTGSQSGIITDSSHLEAEIIEVRPKRIQEALNRGEVAIVAGFQGMSREKEITTLGRGGSDTSAVAIGAAIGAEKVELYKDVPGIGVADPKREPLTKIFDLLTYEEALEIVQSGAGILHLSALNWAKKAGLPLEIRPFYCPDHLGTYIAKGCASSY